PLFLITSHTMRCLEPHSYTLHPFLFLSSSFPSSPVPIFLFEIFYPLLLSSLPSPFLPLPFVDLYTSSP
ncbi:hypothetical protein L0F63_007527, partial [Massospora cicadina]